MYIYENIYKTLLIGKNRDKNDKILRHIFYNLYESSVSLWIILQSFFQVLTNKITSNNKYT